MTKQYESEVLASVHEAALGLAEAGLMSKRTMREFDEMCLTPVREMTPEDIRALRLREHASQAVFARYLNVTTGLVSQLGARREAPARRLLEAPDAGGEERSRGGRLTDTRGPPLGAIHRQRLHVVSETKGLVGGPAMARHGRTFVRMFW